MTNHIRGAAHHSTRLTEDVIKRIRLSHERKVGLKRLAEKHGISTVAVWKIVTRKSWKHVE